MRVALLTLIAVLVVAPVAHAATARVAYHEVGVDPRSGPIVVAVLEYVAAAGERNRLEITPEGRGLRLRDNGADLEPGDGCTRENAKEVTCSEATSVNVDAGDDDDVVTLTALSTATSLVKAGPGDDTVDGTAVADVLDGGGGSDVLRGGAGADTLDDGDASGSANADTLDGGADTDRVSYARRTAGVTVDLNAPAAAGETGERDTLAGVEDVTGGSGADVIRGDDADNELDGAKGRDRMYGGGGDDEVELGRGSDFGDGGAGDDRVLAFSGRDTLIGGDGRDDLVSGLGRKDDLLSGGRGRDRLYAGRGRDILRGGAGPDVMYSNDGRRDRVNGGAGDDRAKVDRRLDRVRRVETLR